MDRMAPKELAIDHDPAAFVASLNDRDARGAPTQMPDGSTVPRLPGFNCWITDGELFASLSMRWQPGTGELPPHVLGHVGFTVVPWKRRRGYATEALGLLVRRWLPWTCLTSS